MKTIEVAVKVVVAVMLVSVSSFAATVNPLSTSPFKVQVAVSPVCTITNIGNFDFGTLADGTIGGQTISNKWDLNCSRNPDSSMRKFEVSVSCANPNNSYAGVGNAANYYMVADLATEASAIPFTLTNEDSAKGSAALSNGAQNTQLFVSTALGTSAGAQSLTAAIPSGFKDPTGGLYEGSYSSTCTLTAYPQ